MLFCQLLSKWLWESDLRSGIDDGYQILSQAIRHTELFRLDNDEVERQEGAKVKHESSDSQKKEWHLLERSDEVFDVELSSRGWQSRFDGNVGNDQQSQEKECHGSHRPTEAYLDDKLIHHDREDDTTETRSSGDYSEGDRTVTLEPCSSSGDSWVSSVVWLRSEGGILTRVEEK